MAMERKRIWAWTGPFIALAAVLSAPGDASAQGFYLGLHGGLNITHDGDVDEYFYGYFYSDSTTVGKAEYDSGAAFGGSLGYEFLNDWRLELEITYRRNAFDEIDWNHFSKVGDFETEGDVASLAFMVNAFWDIDTGTKVTPSLGAGLGVVRVEFDDVSDADGPLFDETETGLGFQLGAGLGYELTETVILSLDYRFFAAFVSPTADRNQPGIGGEEFEMEYTNSTFLLGLRYRF
jgi:opacity protein-like surface antigen